MEYTRILDTGQAGLKSSDLIGLLSEVIFLDPLVLPSVFCVDFGFVSFLLNYRLTPGRFLGPYVMPRIEPRLSVFKAGKHSTHCTFILSLPFSIS